MQAAMESVASVQPVKDWNKQTVDKHFDQVRKNTPMEYHPFWMHPVIQQHYRIKVQAYRVQKMFMPGGFRFNPQSGQDNTFGVFVESLGSYFIVFERCVLP